MDRHTDVSLEFVKADRNCSRLCMAYWSEGVPVEGNIRARRRGTEDVGSSPT